MRSIKYENIYIKGYETMREAECEIADYVEYYNVERPHTWLDYGTPEMAYTELTEVNGTLIGVKSLQKAA